MQVPLYKKIQYYITSKRGKQKIMILHQKGAINYKIFMSFEAVTLAQIIFLL
jgi:hypothetical protein